MFSIESIHRRLKPYITDYSFGSKNGEDLTSVRFWTEDTIPDASCVYIMEAEQLYDTPMGKLADCTIVCRTNAGLSAILPSNTNWFYVNIPVGDLCNILLQLLQDNITLKKQYDCAMTSDGDSLQLLVKAGADFWHRSVLLLNNSYIRLAGRYSEADSDIPLIRKLSDTETILPSEMHELLDRLEFITTDETFSQYAFPGTERFCLIYHIKVSGIIAANLMVVAPEEAISYYRKELSQLAVYVAEVLKKRADSNVLYGPFTELVQNILEERVNKREEVEELLETMPPRGYGRRFSLVMICFENIDKNVHFSVYANRLRLIFPFSNIAVYDSRLLVFTRNEEFSHNELFDHSRFEQFLQESDAYAAIGSETKFLSALPTMFKQCSATIRLAKKLRKDPQERIFRYEDYSIYLIVEMCTSDTFRDFHHGRMYFLCHQDLLMLERYDRKNGTDYVDVLYAYLSNNCRITQTSRTLYMHRNTLIGKIEKIEQLMGKSLENTFLQERLLFSYHVLEYMEKYRETDIFPQSLID